MLETTWFVLWGLLWAVYFVLDGFDFGMGTLLPFLAKNDEEKRIIYNAAGPYWDGNEVWLITAGGVTFAAFPKAYAVMFSALYAPLLILLFALIFRAVSFEFRNKKDCPQWRKFWDACQFLGNFLPALLLGRGLRQPVHGHPDRRQRRVPRQHHQASEPLRPRGRHLLRADFLHARRTLAGPQVRRRHP